MRWVALTTAASLVLLAGVVTEARGQDARTAKLPGSLFRQLDAAKVYPALYKRERERERPSWQRFLRSAREAYMDTHPCSTAVLERRYRTGFRNSWSTVLATWRCDGVPEWEQQFLTCAADHEGGRTFPDVWYGGSRGWQGGRFAGSDRVVGHVQVRPYHARRIVPALAVTDADRTVTLETFLIITDPVNHARIAAQVGVGAFAGSTQATCS